MVPRRRIVLAMMLVTGLVLPGALPGGASAASTAATVVTARQHTMIVHARGPLLPWQSTAIAGAAAAAGASGHRVSSPTLPMTAHERGGRTVWRAPARARIPMAATVVSRWYIRAVGGQALHDALMPGAVAVGRVTAARRGIRVGDTLVLRDRRNRPRPLRVGAIVDQRLVEGRDLLLPLHVSEPRFGAMSVSHVVISGIRTPESVEEALRARGFVIGTEYRLRRSWDPPDPDDVLGSSEVAARFGQLVYATPSRDRITVLPPYTDRLVRVAYSGVALRHHCHASVVGAIQSALTEIAEAGLADRIDTTNSNRYGGCFASRYARFQGAYGTPSRHAWGIAFDINTVANAQGKVPVLDCDVVRIMRKWGFSWGGNFLRPDGMHFEWAGGRRDLMGYPSRYCPNLVPVPEAERPVFPGDPPPEDPDAGTDEPTP